MVNPALMLVERHERRRALRDEARHRASGNWGDWETFKVPAFSIGPTGWPAEAMIAHRNRVFCVLNRVVPGDIRHLAVSSLSGIRPDWREMQRIKNEIAGKTRTAVEVYPPESEVVDGADMFHIWVLPSDQSLPYGLWR